MIRVSLAPVAAAVLLLTSSAGADVVDDIKKHEAAIVLVQAGANRGTGFFVNEPGKAPVVATCFHVVAGASPVKVYSRWAGETYRVVGVHADPDNDLAFLQIDIADRSVQDDVIAWAPGKADRPGAFFGYADQALSNFEPEPMRNPVNMVKWDVALTRIGADKVRLDLPVIHTNLPDFYAGDSGGPVFNRDGALVGLAAGFVRTGKKNNSFAVPIRGSVPTTFAALPAKGSDPYGDGASVVRAVLTRDVPWSLSSSDKSADRVPTPCLRAIEAKVSRFRGRRDELPPALPPSDLPPALDPPARRRCNDLYARLRDPLVGDERHRLEARTGLELARDAERIESKAPAPATLEDYAAKAEIQTKIAAAGRHARAGMEALPDDARPEARAIEARARTMVVPPEPVLEGSPKPPPSVEFRMAAESHQEAADLYAREAQRILESP